MRFILCFTATSGQNSGIFGEFFVTIDWFVFSFQEHVVEMFGEDAERPGWDKNGFYTPDNIDVSLHST